MPLTTRQRNALPRSAFVLRRGPRSAWRYPVPTKTQAARAGISEAQRIRTHRAALAYSARGDTRGSHTTIRRVVAKRHAGGIATVARRARRGTSRKTGRLSAARLTRR